MAKKISDEISDELRKWCESENGTGCGGFVTKKISDKLREWGYGFCGDTHDVVTAIADRIDAEHERAMAAAALIVGVPITDENMAEHGWVRLPVDADGVTWTGEEHFFRDAKVGGARFLFGLSYFGDGRWEIIDHYQNEVGADPAMCRHAPDRPADTPASLADELESLADGVDGRVPQVPDDLRDIADRLRQLLDECGVYPTAQEAG